MRTVRAKKPLVDRAERTVEMMKNLDYLEKNDPKRFAEAMRTLARLVVKGGM